MHGRAGSVLAHAACKLSSTRLYAFDQRADGEVIRLEPAASHQMEEVPRLSHVVATHVDIDEGVESHVGGLQTNLLHPIEKLLGTVEHLLLGAAFNQGVVGHLVYMEEVVGGVFLQKLHNLNGFLHLLALNAAVQKDVQKHFSALLAKLRSSHSLNRIEVSRLGRVAATRTNGKVDQVFLAAAAASKKFLLNLVRLRRRYLLDRRRAERSALVVVTNGRRRLSEDARIGLIRGPQRLKCSIIISLLQSFVAEIPLLQR